MTINKLTHKNSLSIRIYVELWYQLICPRTSHRKQNFVTSCIAMLKKMTPLNQHLESSILIIVTKKLWKTLDMLSKWNRISINETADVEEKHISNVIIRTTEEDRASKIFLLNTNALAKANHSIVTKFFDESLRIFWPAKSNTTAYYLYKMWHYIWLSVENYLMLFAREWFTWHALRMVSIGLLKRYVLIVA